LGKNGGRDRDRTCDPYHVKFVPLPQLPLTIGDRLASP
jgi:hypothetical protein